MREREAIIKKGRSKAAFIKKQIRLGLAQPTIHFKTFSYCVGIFLLSFFSAFFASSFLSPTVPTNADTNTADSTTADGYTLTLSSTSAVNLGLTLGPVDTMTVSAGNVNVITNSPGYRLFIGMVGASDNLQGTGSASSYAITGITGTLTAPAALTRGTWGYAIPSGTTHLSPNGFNDAYSNISSGTPDSTKKFAIPPVSTNKPDLIAVSTSATDSAGDSYPVYYGVRANLSTPQGEYSNSVMFTAIADAGAAHSATILPTGAKTNTATTAVLSTTLYSTGVVDLTTYLLTEAQYNTVMGGTPVETIAGTTTVSCSRTSSTPVKLSCTVPAIGVAGTYYLYTKSLTYGEAYSVSFTITKPEFYSVSTMQDFAKGVYCASATTPNASAQYDDLDGSHNGDKNYTPTIILKDSRDQKDYTIKKLADGRCWMTDNLRLSDAVLTSAESDLPEGATFNLPASSTARWCTTSNSINCDGTANVLDADASNPEYGTYYNFYAATAGYGPYGTIGDTEWSICPKGWKLPKGGSSGDYQQLINAGYNTAALMTKDQGGPNYVLSGRRDGASWNGQGTSNFSWTMTGNNANAAYRTVVENGVSATNTMNKYRGLTVRCVMQDFWSINTMQQMTREVASTVVTPSTTAPTSVTTRAAYDAVSDKTTVVPQRTLTDARDSEQYRVRKLADGNVWMTENLRLTLTEGQAIETSKGTMWTPANYNGTTTDTTTLTYADFDSAKWWTASPSQSELQHVRSYNNAGSAGHDVCAFTEPDSGESGLHDRQHDECYETATTYDGETQTIGVYYNYYTASAGEMEWNSEAIADNSICPRNWVVPYNTGGNSTTSTRPGYVFLLQTTYGIQFNAENSYQAASSFPVSLIPGGLVKAELGQPRSQRVSGYYLVGNRTGTAGGVSGLNARFILANSSTNKISTSNARARHGISIRCAIMGY